jgi:nucleotide-binding universal stress UspA family protein
MQALLWGAHFGAAYGAPLQVVTAWQYPLSEGWAAPLPSDWNPAQGMDTALHDAVRAVFGAQPPAAMRLQVLEGNPAKVLLDASDDAIMLVVGSRGHGGFAGLLLGSVSANVVEHASCPVFVVHGDDAPPALGPV